MPIVYLILRQAAVSLVGLLGFIGLEVAIPARTPEEIAQVYQQNRRAVDEIIAVATGDATSTPLLDAAKVAGNNSTTTETLKRATEALIPTEEKPTPTLPKRVVVEIPFVPVTPIEQPVPSTPEPTIPPIEEPEVEPEPVNELVESANDAVVRVSCIKTAGGAVSLIVASGVIVDSRGIVLTNAHVGRFFLPEMRDEGYSCTLGRYNIPTVGYLADPIFVSSRWLKDNPTENIGISDGRNDVALLTITKSSNAAIPLPKSFPAIEARLSAPEVGQRVTAIGYPGVSSGILSVDSMTNLVADATRVTGVFSYDGGSTDVFSLDSTSNARQGSSGGAVVDSNDRLIGLIATVSGSGSYANINALTTHYVNEIVEDELSEELFD